MVQPWSHTYKKKKNRKKTILFQLKTITVVIIAQIKTSRPYLLYNFAKYNSFVNRRVIPTKETFYPESPQCFAINGNFTRKTEKSARTNNSFGK